MHRSSSSAEARPPVGLDIWPLDTAGLPDSTARTEARAEAHHHQGANPTEMSSVDRLLVGLESGDCVRGVVMRPRVGERDRNGIVA